MDRKVLEVTPRDVTGKERVKALRSKGFVPAALYGKGVEARLLSVDAAELEELAKTATFASTIFDLKLKGKKKLLANVIIQELQTHPVTRKYLHLDFHSISLKEKIAVSIPMNFIGEPIGAEMGGFLEIRLHAIEIECLPADIPEQVEFDVSEMKIGDSVHVVDLEVEKIKILTDPQRTVVTMNAPKVSTELEEEAEEAAEEPDAEEEAGEEE